MNVYWYLTSRDILRTSYKSFSQKMFVLNLIRRFSWTGLCIKQFVYSRHFTVSSQVLSLKLLPAQWKYQC